MRPSALSRSHELPAAFIPEITTWRLSSATSRHTSGHISFRGFRIRVQFWFNLRLLPCLDPRVELYFNDFEWFNKLITLGIIRATLIKFYLGALCVLDKFWNVLRIFSEHEIESGEIFFSPKIQCGTIELWGLTTHWYRLLVFPKMISNL